MVWLLKHLSIKLMQETGRQSKSGSKVSGLYIIWSRGWRPAWHLVAKLENAKIQHWIFWKMVK